MKTLKLGVADRINIEAFFPKAAGRVEMGLVRDMTGKLTFTPEEVRDFQMTDGPGGIVRWNVAAEKEIDAELSEQQIEVLKKGIQRIDEMGEVTLAMLSLIEKIEN